MIRSKLLLLTALSCFALGGCTGATALVGNDGDRYQRCCNDR